MLDFSKLAYVDTDGDGEDDGIGGIAQTFTPGSAEARKLWHAISQDAHSPENVAKAKALTGNENATGMFMDKPLIPNSNGAGEGDFDFLTAKLCLQKGYSLDVAKKIAASVKNKLYRGK